VQGESVERAAADLEITIHTVRAQLKALFSKTAINRQAELVRVLLRSTADVISR